MRPDRLEFLVHLFLADAPVIPAGDQRQPVMVEDGPKRAAVARELAAKLGTGIAGFRGFGEAGLERRVAAQFRHVVIGPGDRVDAKSNCRHCSLSAPQPGWLRGVWSREEMAAIAGGRAKTLPSSFGRTPSQHPA